jgi:hypothetical protein
MRLYNVPAVYIILSAFHIGTILYHPALSSAFENRGMLVSVPVNGNKRGAVDTFLSAYRNHPFPAERTVKAVLVFKYPNVFFG